MIEILCSQWNHGYTIGENVAEVFKEVYFITNIHKYLNGKKPTVKVMKSSETCHHASRPSTSANYNEKVKETVLEIRVGMRDSRGSQQLL